MALSLVFLHLCIFCTDRLLHMTVTRPGLSGALSSEEAILLYVRHLQEAVAQFPPQEMDST